jgi:hypothetical protein
VTRAETAICFTCNNALTFIDGVRGWFEFDAASRQGRMLHSALRRHEHSRHRSAPLTRASAADAVAALASIIDAPENRLPAFEHSEDPSLPRIQLEGRRATYVVVEQGEELSRRSTDSLDELLYWVFTDLTFYMSCVHEVSHRVEGGDPWRSLFVKQMDLIRELDELWFERFRRERRARLAELGL